MTSNYPQAKQGNEKQYSVEKVLDKRIFSDKKGERTQYLLKWIGYAEATWEDEANLIGCRNLISAFNEQRDQQDSEDLKKRSWDAAQLDKNNTNDSDITSPKKRKNKLAQPGDTVGFQFGDTPETILGGRMKDGAIHLYIKWVGKEARTFVPASICNQKIPQKVIAFYESRLSFGQEIDDNSSEGQD